MVRTMKWGISLSLAKTLGGEPGFPGSFKQESREGGGYSDLGVGDLVPQGGHASEILRNDIV